MKINRKNLLSRGQISKVIKEDKLETMQKELDAVGGTKIFLFEISTVEELITCFVFTIAILSAFSLLVIMQNGNIKGVIGLILGVLIMFYVKWKKPIDDYKESFMKDSELPSALETIIAGLDAGLPLAYILRYIAKYKKGNTAKLLSEAVRLNDAGKNLSYALLYVADKSFSKYFKRMAYIINKSDISLMNLTEQLAELQNDIEEERKSIKTEKVNKLDNALFFPILLGYFVPLVLMLILPFAMQLKTFGM